MWLTKMYRNTSIWLLIFVLTAFLAQRTLCGKQTDYLEHLDGLLKNYDRRATPTNHLNTPTIVNCELFIRSFGFKDPSSMDYQVDLYFRQTWKDNRLEHENITQSLDLNDPNLVKAIWKPEVYFPNAKDASFEYVTVPNVLLRINPRGHILYMLRLKLVFACMMELSKFPLDSQICTMEVASFSKTIRELNLHWKSLKPVAIYRGLRMPQFEITDIVATTCQESFQIGNYSCLLVEFHMRRSVGFHVVQSYVPTVLFVVISWLSFWMDVESLLPRTSLGITTLLTVSSKSSALQGGVPQVSYVKAIDVWMGTCTAFVFCSLLELTVINCLWRKQRLTILQNQKNVHHIKSSTTTSFIATVGASSNRQDEPNYSSSGGSRECPSPKITAEKSVCELQMRPITLQHDAKIPAVESSEEYKLLARKIDAWCRVLFPATFIAFVGCYWCYYFL